jgi:hypothetical protein
MNTDGMKYRLTMKIKKMFLTKQEMALIFIDHRFKKIRVVRINYF